MYKSLFVQFVFLMICFLTTMAQDKNEETKLRKPLSVTVSAFHFFNNALKLDVEQRSLDKSWSYLGGLEVYSGKIGNLYQLKNQFNEDVFDKISGFGLNAAIKYNFEKTGGLNTFYLSGGATFRNLNFKLDGPMYYSYQDQGVAYITYGNHRLNERVSPFLIYTTLGRYLEVERVVFDFYIGVGYRILKQNQTLLSQRKYHEYSYGYNYLGFNTQFGVKIGGQIFK